jgi:hypothetical protein
VLRRIIARTLTLISNELVRAREKIRAGKITRTRKRTEGSNSREVTALRAESPRACEEIIVVCKAAIFLLIVGQNTLMSAECDRALAMVPGDQSRKVASIPLVTIQVAAQQPEVVAISVVAAPQQPEVVVISVRAAAHKPLSTRRLSEYPMNYFVGVCIETSAVAEQNTLWPPRADFSDCRRRLLALEK